MDTEAQRRQLLDEFTAEALEHLDAAETGLLAVEAAGWQAEIQAEVLRAMHSLKGAAGYVGLQSIQQLAHLLETACQESKAELGPDPGPVGLLLEGVTELRRLVDYAAAHDGHTDEPLADVMAALRAGQPAGSDSTPAAPRRRTIADIFLEVAGQQVQSMRAASERLAEGPDDAVGRAMLEQAVSSLRSAAEYANETTVLALLAEHLPDSGQLAPSAALPFIDALEALLGAKLAPALAPPDAAVAPAADNAPYRLPAGGQIALGTLRVAQARVDQLISGVSELVTVRNQLQHFLGRLEAEGDQTVAYRQGKALAAALAHAVDEVQSVAMELRLVRLEQVFRPLARVVRDVTGRTGKPARLEMTGGDTEVDKGLAEAIADPLMHLVRNAVDHGLETAAERAEVGKSPEGLVRIASRREANELVVTVSDDGRGVDLPAVRAKAVERGLVTADAAADLSTEGLCDLLFQPGFSTAPKVTEISGRGIGLDVVRSNLHRLGGTVSLAFAPGQGTQVELRLPVRLATREVVLVRVPAGLFAIPLESVSETLSLPAAQCQTVAGRPAFVRHGRLVLLISLAEMLGLGQGARCAATPVGEHGDRLEVVVAQAEQPVGLLVDEIGSHQQVVVKPLETYLATRGVSGAAVLGDGRVVLVLDPPELLASPAG